jgi:hypothetical protein
MVKVFKFNYITFFVAFILGLIYVTLSVPKMRKIIKYPTPYNADKILYKGLSGDCYKFKAEEVNCDDKSIPQPII